MSISLQEVTKIYGEQRAVNNISIEIPKGQVVGFLGPNGAGKSTTMKMITGFLAPSAGTIEVCGLNVATSPIESRSKIGYLPESNPQYMEMYVREYLAFMASVHGIKQQAEKRIEDMIALTSLTREAHKKIGALSKGYKQRVGIAQALLHNPDVLVLDEPTSGLDPNQIVDIRDLITTIGKEKTVMLSTHIMQEVSAMCERVIIINKGEIVKDSPIGELQLHNGKQNILLSTKQSITVENFGEIKDTTATQVNNNTIRFASINADVAKKAILQLCIQNGFDIESISNEENNLENIFRELTK